MKFGLFRHLAACTALLVFSGMNAVGAECLVKDGDRIAFIGDSITEFGNWPAGYINMVVKALELDGINVTKIPVGHSAETSDNMARRFDRDVVAAKPDWVTISCGVNDVERMKDPKTGKVNYEKYRKNVRDMLDKAAAAGIKPVLLTPTIRYELVADNDQNKQILELGAFMKEEAAARNIPVADLNARMRSTLAKMPASDKPRLTRDGVHMNFDGDRMMASGVLEAFGVEVTPEMEAAWRDLPDAKKTGVSLNWNEVQKLESLKREGETRKLCAERLIRESVDSGVRMEPVVGKSPKKMPDGQPDIVFIGDKVVSFGSDNAGWATMVVKALSIAEGRDIIHRTACYWLHPDNVELEKKAMNFAEEKPGTAVLILGSNEMKANGVKQFAEKLADIKLHMTNMVDRFRAAGSDVVVLGLTPMCNTADGESDKRAVKYNEWLKVECESRGVKFVDLHTLMAAELMAHAGEKEAEPFGEGYLTQGWYHLIFNYRGNSFIAKIVLSALGINVTDEIEAKWRTLDNAVRLELGFSMNGWEKYSPEADQRLHKALK